MSDSKTINKKILQKPVYFKEDEMEALELISKGLKFIDKDLRSEISDGRKIDSCEDEEIQSHYKFSNSCIYKKIKNKAKRIPFIKTLNFLMKFLLILNLILYLNSKEICMN